MDNNSNPNASSTATASGRPFPHTRPRTHTHTHTSYPDPETATRRPQSGQPEAPSWHRARASAAQLGQAPELRPSCAIQKREVPCAELHPTWLVGGVAASAVSGLGLARAEPEGSCGPGPGPGTVQGHRRPVLELSVGGALSSRGTILGRRAGRGRAGRGLFVTGRRGIAEVPVPVGAGLGPLQSLLPGVRSCLAGRQKRGIRGPLIGLRRGRGGKASCTGLRATVHTALRLQVGRSMALHAHERARGRKARALIGPLVLLGVACVLAGPEHAACIR
jgi:hypothetical protein